MSIENYHVVASAIGDVAELAVCIKRDAMSSLHAGNGANSLTCCSVEHFNTRAMGNVEQVRARVREQVIPASSAADLPMINHLVGLLSRCVAECSESDGACNDRQPCAGGEEKCVHASSVNC